MDRQRTERVYRALCTRKGITRPQQLEFYFSKGKEHCKELTDEELNAVIANLKTMPDSEEGVLINWRRKAMAVCYKYLNAAGYENPSSDYVKECICTCQRATSLNFMTKSQLIKAFYLFKKRYEEAAKGMVEEMPNDL